MLRFATTLTRVLQNRLVWYAAGIGDAALITYLLVK